MGEFETGQVRRALQSVEGAKEVFGTEELVDLVLVEGDAVEGEVMKRERGGFL
jgi:hypothetical protein